MKSDEGGGVRAKYQSPNFLTDMIHNSILEEIHHTCLLITLPTHTHTHTHTHTRTSLATDVSPLLGVLLNELRKHTRTHNTRTTQVTESTVTTYISTVYDGRY